MSKMEPTEIGKVALRNGFPRDEQKLLTAIAIALAESGGRTDVVNSVKAVGLWQIHIPSHPQYSVSQMQNPDENAKAMVAISGAGSNWRPWEAYTNKSYVQHLLIAGSAAKNALADKVLQDHPLGGVSGAIDSTADAVGGTVQALGSISELLRRLSDPEFQRRFAKVVIGVVLLIVGLVILSKDLVGPAVKTAVDVAL